MQIYSSSGKKKLNTAKMHCASPLLKAQAPAGTCKKPTLDGRNHYVS